MNYKRTSGFRIEGWVVHITADYNFDRWLGSDSFVVAAERQELAERATQKQ